MASERVRLHVRCPSCNFIHTFMAWRGEEIQFLCPSEETMVYVTEETWERAVTRPREDQRGR